MLTPEQLAARDGKVTASFLPKLMAGDETAILREWQRLVDHPDYAPEDLSDKWPVQFGSFIEPFALDWHEAMTGRKLTRRGEVVTHPALPHVCCTLDAFREDDRCVIDCKAPGMWRKVDQVCAHYLPQMVVQRDCLGAERAALLIVHGGSEPAEYALDIPDEYAAQVWQRVEWFWRCVSELSPPVALDPVAAPVPAVKVISMDGSNAWAMHAADWRENRMAARAFDTAAKAIKDMVPNDAGRCFGHSIEVVRNKAGSLTIKEFTNG